MFVQGESFNPAAEERTKAGLKTQAGLALKKLQI
jgi:hypothetical protein